MNVFELAAKITLDSSGFDAGIGSAKSSMQSLGSSLEGIVTKSTVMGNAIYDGVKAAASGFSELAQKSIGAYADTEQLIGGVDTLFKDSAGIVKDYAQTAYKDAGMTANEYMETVTSFSASLVQSIGRVEQTSIEELEIALDKKLKDQKRANQDSYNALKEEYNQRIALAKANKDGTEEILKQERDEQLLILKRSNEDMLEEMKRANKEIIAQAEQANNQSVVTADTYAQAAEKANQAVIDMADKMLVRLKSIELYQRCGRNPANGKSPNEHKARVIPCQVA